MKVTVLLADKGTPNPLQGSLNLLNAGWSQTPSLAMMSPTGPITVTPAHAVAVFFEVEPRHCNHPIELKLELVTQDGRAVEVAGPAGPQTMTISQQLVVTSPAGAPVGSPGTGNALLEFTGLPIPPGNYEWRVTLAGEHEEHWNARFQVVESAQPQPPTIGSQ